MEINLENARKYLSRIYLDLAEKGYLNNYERIQELKRIRERQVKYAEDAYIKSRPPTEARLIPLSTRIIELYRIEEYKRFRNSLLSFLPELSNPVGLSTLETLRDFNKRETRQWLNMGVISREPLLGMVIRFDPNLPKAIYYFDLHLNRVLPSIFILAIDIVYSQNHLIDLDELQSKRYLPEVVLYDLLLHGNYIPHSFGSSERVASNAIANWEAGLRNSVINYFNPILFGFFSASNKPKYGNLPFLDVWTIQGSPEDRNDYPSWEIQHSRWLESVGFNHFSHRYQNDEYILEYPSRSFWDTNEQAKRQGRLIILDRQFAKFYEHKGFSDHISSIMHRDSANVLNDFLAFTAISAFIDEANETLLRLRNVIFDRFSDLPPLTRPHRV